MSTVVVDIETDALDATKIWVICAEDVDTGVKTQYLNVDMDDNEADKFRNFITTYDKIVMHNGIGFDAKIINKFLGADTIDLQKVVDTLVVSRLLNYDIRNGHSLEAWGQRLGDYKGDFKDFSNLSQEMIEYCHQDVTVTAILYRRFKKEIEAPEWQKALRCEHDIQILCEQMTDNGFYFNKTKAQELLDDVLMRMSKLEAGFQKDFPPQLEEVNRIIYRKKADGTLYANVERAMRQYKMTRLDKSVTPNELVCYDLIAFDPASPMKRIDRLWEAGWQPYEKTKGHMEHERQQTKNRRRW
jgi:DNA polymerase-1